MSKTEDLFGNSLVAVDDPTLKWPSPERFPINIVGSRVRHQIDKDFVGALDILVVTGYASLGEVVRCIARSQSDATVRVLFGTEPYGDNRRRRTFKPRRLPVEMREYWLSRGFSPELCIDVFETIQKLKDGRAGARYMGTEHPRLHAKIYVSNDAATVGSSNFTLNGLEKQSEVNARFSRRSDPARHKELTKIATNYWDQGTDYKEELIRLLEGLLAVVSWEHALAKACAELLEGDWARSFFDETGMSLKRLWPSQKQGIAQAMYVLARHGSVLIADATGSGKTRLGTHLIRAIRNQLAATGRLSVDYSVMICPPTVMDSWQEEADGANVGLNIHSQGVLSHTSSRKHEQMSGQLARTQLLCVDEVHNFLNTKSNRTQRLLRHVADNVVVFTATPINKGLTDLLPIIDVLGADNLDDETLEQFDRLLRRSKGPIDISDEQLEPLRKEVQKFTVRRTKAMFNELIDREPSLYTDRSGRECRYPKHLPKTYELNESDKDIQLATEIQDLAGELYAVRSFAKRPIRMPVYFKERGVTEEQYLERRLKSAQVLAQYQVSRCLRSSRAALIEHILGTEESLDRYKIGKFEKGQPTGNLVAALESLGGKLPKNELSVDLPQWLSNVDEHHNACSHDKAIYERIVELVGLMSASRERAKAEHLLEIAKSHDLVVAFDKTPITLAYIKAMLEKDDDAPPLFLAFGAQTDKAKVIKAFALGSKDRGVALCSDSLSEGVNLQQASALVHLDMPSVVRIAEQRVGRIDRMDSPHDAIDVWWPDDADVFALSADDRFKERFDTVERLLGSNMPLPDTLSASSNRMSAKDMIKEVEERASRREALDYDEMKDAFEPVRDLVQGKTAIVSDDAYDGIFGTSKTIVSRVSVVKSAHQWAFFCLRGGTFGAPRWVLFEGQSRSVETDLAGIAEQLRARLTGTIEDRPFDRKAATVFRRFYDRLSSVEKSLLPRMKRRALEEMRWILERYMKLASKRHDQVRLDLYGDLVRMLDTGSSQVQPDWDDVATKWLRVIRPTWYEKLHGIRTKPLLLKDIRNELLENEEVIGKVLSRVFDDVLEMSTSEERLSSCIIGF